MKWIFRLFTICSLCAALAFPLFIKDKSGTPMWTIPGLSGSETPTLLEVKKLPPKDFERQVFKWQDANGVWQYGDTPPGDQTAQMITVSSNTNIIQSLKTADERQDQDPVLKPVPSANSPRAHLSEEAQETLEQAENTELLSFDRALNVVEEAKAVRELMNFRNQQLDGM